MEGIERTPTELERRDFKVINENTESISDKFNRLLNEKEVECTKKRIHFCRRCAKLDFQKAIKEKIERAEERGDFYANEGQLKIQFPDLDEYTKADRFNVLGEREVLNPANALKGTKAEMHICKVFQCKERKCNISIFFTEEELNNARVKEVSDMSKQSSKKK